MQSEEESLINDNSTGGRDSSSNGQLDHETTSMNDGNSRSYHDPGGTSAGNSASDQQQQQHQQQPQAATTTSHQTSCQGYYDAEKCRAHIANQTRVSKIDRVAAQIARALEVETSFQSRLTNVMNMFLKHAAQIAHKFTTKCKFGLKRHREDRILSNNAKRRRGSSQGMSLTVRRFANKTTRGRQAQDKRSADYLGEQFTISNDLLYGEGAQLIHELLSQKMTIDPPIRLSSKHSTNTYDDKQDSKQNLDITRVDCWEDTQFEPDLYVKKLEDYLRVSLRKSNLITAQLNRIKSTFERLASEHRDQVDLVYAAEENRQATTVIRRSAYNLSMAAIKATSTPVHVTVAGLGQ